MGVMGVRRRTPVEEPRDQSSPPAPRRADLWFSLIQPALLIGLVGACAATYLIACARLSVIECDQRRLERIAENEEARELNLHRRLAELRNAEQIRAHIGERGLCRPVAVAHVSLTDVPPAVCAVLPGAGPEERGREVRLGQLPADTAGALYPSLASAP